jgi:hypothetical protein
MRPVCCSGLLTVSLAKRAATTMRKNAVAIKEEVLRFVKANTAEYEVLLKAPRVCARIVNAQCVY